MCEHLWIVDAWWVGDFEWINDVRVPLGWVATHYRCQKCAKRVSAEELSRD